MFARRFIYQAKMDGACFCYSSLFWKKKRGGGACMMNVSFLLSNIVLSNFEFARRIT